MPLRTVASLVVAIFLGLIAVVLVRSALAGQKGGHATPTIPVVAAIAPIQPGTPLKADMVKVVRYPSDAVPAGSFRSIDQLFPQNGQPRTVQRVVAQNAPVLAADLNGAASRATLSGVIHAGMRAVSLRSSDVSGVAGFVLPGDRVDILLTRTIGTGPAAKPLTQVLAQNALVLGVDQTSDPSTDKPIVAKAVTVEVSADQAQTISLAQSVGELSLTLRQTLDDAQVSKRMTTVADLAGPAPPPRRRIVKVADPGVSVRVVRGVDATAYAVAKN